MELLLGTIRTANVALTIPKLQERVNLAKGKIEKILEFLLLESPAPIQKTAAGYVLNPVRWQMPADRIARITNLRRGELGRMQVYVGNQDCLMQFLAEELNDPNAGPCGKCVNCTEHLVAEDYPEELAQAAVEFLDRQEISIQPRKRWPPGLTDPEMHGNIAAAQQAQEGRALCRWGDPGFGTLVRRGKQQEHHFDEQLVDAAACLIGNRWRPDPAPTWITCVPSRRHQTLPGLRAPPRTQPAATVRRVYTQGEGY